MSKSTEQTETGDEERYLVFLLENELYGTPLLGVREVLEPLTPKAIPNTAQHFKGLINVRGQIIGVVDLRVRFGYPASHSERLAYLVFETESGPIAAIVDRAESVLKIDDELIQKQLDVRSQLPVAHLIGAAVHGSQPITLIDLNKTLSADDYVEIHKAKMAVVG